MKAKLPLYFFLLFTTFVNAYTKAPKDAFNTIELFAIKDPKVRKAHYETRPLQHLNLSAGLSTLGLTVETATPLASHLKLRVGLNYINLNSDHYTMNLDDRDQSFFHAFGIEPKLRLSGKVNLFHGHALVDYYPFKKGIFFVSAGAYIGNTKFNVNGELTDTTGRLVELLEGQDWPTLEFDGHLLNTNGGKVDAELKIGNPIKPYLGIGLGRAVSKKRLGFKLELGVLYQGDYTISQAGQKVIKGDEATAYIEDANKYTRWLKWWPKISFQVNYRLF